MHSAHSWSLINPRPVLVYLKHYDNYIVYWNGIIMTHSIALAITMEEFGIFSTPKMRESMRQEYMNLYYGGAFGTREWDDMVRSNHGNLYSYLRNLMHTHLKEIFDKSSLDRTQVIRWFDYSTAIHEE